MLPPMTIRVTRALPDRPIPKELDGLVHSLNFQIVPLLKELVRALTAPPTGFVWTSGAASIDVGAGSDFWSYPLTEDSTLTLENGVDGMAGQIVITQDAIGSYGLNFLVDGRTIMLADPMADTDPNPDPNGMTLYRYSYTTVVTSPYVIIERVILV